MKVLVLGPDWRNHEIIAVLTELGHDVKLWNEELARVKLDEWGIDFIVSNGFGPIIKEPILTSFKEKIVNIHPAYLPHGRGIYPNFWSFFEGYPKGVTIHYIDAGIDTGNILLREAVVFESGETLRSTNEILMTRARNLFLNNVQKILSGEIQSIDQSSEPNNSFYHSRTISEYFVELLPEGWDTPVEYVESLGRDFMISRRFIEIYHDCIKK